MKIGIASDHRGFKLKKFLKENLKDYEIVDYGTFTEESSDYPDYGIALAEKVSTKDVEKGIAICGSGIGISIACNKVKGIRCAKVSTEEEAKYTRNDNDSNIVALSAAIGEEEALKIVKTFLETPFSNDERHKRRINKIRKYEEEHGC
ncbi:MAG: RpiB/LacA/LacB family sugar-phosphate isomerase [Bacilli bacterium]|nr:RpiB/LacA/LacB family sugar-phosphate isomerase [Bacilli bacterium]